MLLLSNTKDVELGKWIDDVSNLNQFDSRLIDEWAKRIRNAFICVESLIRFLHSISLSIIFVSISFIGTEFAVKGQCPNLFVNLDPFFRTLNVYFYFLEMSCPELPLQMLISGAFGRPFHVSRWLWECTQIRFVNMKSKLKNDCDWLRKAHVFPRSRFAFRRESFPRQKYELFVAWLPFLFSYSVALLPSLGRLAGCGQSEKASDFEGNTFLVNQFPVSSRPVLSSRVSTSHVDSCVRTRVGRTSLSLSPRH